MGFFKNYRRKIVILLITLALFGITITLGKIITTNAIKENEMQREYLVWLSDNCNCINEENLTCLEYDCENQIITLDNTTNKWSPILENWNNG